MYIVLTEKATGAPIVLGAQTVLIVKKDQQDRLTTKVVTGIAGPQGLQAFTVTESPEQVFERLMAAQRWAMLQPPTVELSELGFGRCGSIPSVVSMKN